MTREDKAAFLYHFTSVLHLPAIVASRALIRTESNIGIDRPHAGPDCVWFVNTPDLGNFNLGVADQIGEKTAVRFTVAVPEYLALPWVEWAVGLGIDDRMLRAVIKAGGGPEAAAQWRIVLRPVRVDRWVRVDRTDTGEAIWEQGQPLEQMTARTETEREELKIRIQGKIAAMSDEEKGARAAASP